MNLRKAFTLVEILIVVVILGILAAIVIPQFTNASESAKASSILSQLQTIRSQLELFQVQHRGRYPNLGAGEPEDWRVMTAKSSDDWVGPGADQDGGDFGPYLQQAPKNPFTNSTRIGAQAAEDIGWVYIRSQDGATASIYAVVEAEKAKKLFPEKLVNGDIPEDDPDIKTY